MAERAVQLVGEVFPEQPVRQWALSVQRPVIGRRSEGVFAELQDGLQV